MNKLLPLLLLGFLASCERENPPDDAAARASGRYAIQSYILNGDTLYSIFVLPPSYSIEPPANPASEGIRITAKKQ